MKHWIIIIILSSVSFNLVAEDLKKTSDPIIIGNLLVHEHDSVGIIDLCNFWGLYSTEISNSFSTPDNSIIEYIISEYAPTLIRIRTSQKIPDVTKTLKFLGFRRVDNNSKEIVYLKGSHLTKNLIRCTITKDSQTIVIFKNEKNLK